MGQFDLSFGFAAAFTVLVIYAIITDVTRLTIPNWVSIALIALFAAFVLPGVKQLPALHHVMVAVAVLAVGFAAFAGGFMGAGDIKLISAVALWAGPDMVLQLLLYTSLTGAALALVIVAGTFYLRWDGSGRAPTWISGLFPRWVRRGLTPYGFAIGVGALLTVPSVIL